jgi:hypothetical protein
MLVDIMPFDYLLPSSSLELNNGVVCLPQVAIGSLDEWMEGLVRYLLSLSGSFLSCRVFLVSSGGAIESLVVFCPSGILPHLFSFLSACFLFSFVHPFAYFPPSPFGLTVALSVCYSVLSHSQFLLLLIGRFACSLHQSLPVSLTTLLPLLFIFIPRTRRKATHLLFLFFYLFFEPSVKQMTSLLDSGNTDSFMSLTSWKENEILTSSLCRSLCVHYLTLDCDIAQNSSCIPLLIDDLAVVPHLSRNQINDSHGALGATRTASQTLVL